MLRNVSCNKSTAAQQPAVELPQILTEPELCDYLGKSRAWAQKARFEGRGPKFVKAGRKPLYPVEYVREWLLSSAADNTVQN